MPSTAPARTSAQATRLRVALGRLSRRFRVLYTAAGDDDISFLELAVLSRLERVGELTPSDLASGEKVTTQAVAAALRSLEDRELVSRAGHPTDGRRVVVRLTRRGTLALSGRERSSVAHLTATLTRDFTAAERVQLAEALPLLERLADRL